MTEADDDNKKWETFRRAVLARHLYGRFEKICGAHHVTVRDAFGPTKTKQVVNARTACWQYMRDAGFSTTEIGDMWGRDATGVIQTTNRAKARERENDGVEADIVVQKSVREQIETNLLILVAETLAEETIRPELAEKLKAGIDALKRRRAEEEAWQKGTATHEKS